MSRTVKDLPVELRKTRRERAEKNRTRERRWAREQRAVVLELQAGDAGLREAA